MKASKRKRRFQARLRLPVLAVALLCFLNAGAYDFAVDGIFYNILYDQDEQPTEYVEVTNENVSNFEIGTNSYSGDIVIPSEVTYNGVTYIVNQIKNAAFADCENLNSVVCPPTMQYIGGNAFAGSPITSVTLNEGLIMIGTGAFSRTRLSELYIPNTVTRLSDTGYFGIWYTLYNMGDLVPDTTNIILRPDNPNFVMYDDALYTKDMKQLLIFPRKSSLKSHNGIYRVPEGVEIVRDLGSYRNIMDGEIKKVILPKTVKELCTKLYRNIFIQSPLPPSTLSDVPPGPENLKFEETYAEMIYVPVGSREAYERVSAWDDFVQNEKIEEMVMDREHTISVKTEILDKQVSVTVNGSADKEVKVSPFTPVRIAISKPEKDWWGDGISWLNVDGESYMYNFEDYSKNYDKMLEQYEQTGQWTRVCEFFSLDDTAIDIGIGVDEFYDEELPLKYRPIASSAVAVGKSYEGDMDVIRIPESVEHYGKVWAITDIDSYGFWESQSKEAYIPGTVKRIGGCAFGECLEQVHFEEGVETIEGGAFSNTRISEVLLPQSITKCGNSAFGTLRKANIPPNMTNADNVFTYVEELTIDDSPNKLYGQRLFGNIGRQYIMPIKLYIGRELVKEDMFAIPVRPVHNYRSVQEVTFGPALTRLYDNMFANSKQLSKIVFSGKEFSIGGNAFAGCTGLTDVTIQSDAHIQSIGIGAFQDCMSLERLVLPDAVDSIGYYAMSGCIRLEEITIPATLGEIKNNIFYGCFNLHTVNIADGSEPLKIYNTAFDDCPIETLYYGRNIEESHPSFFGTHTLRRLDIGGNIGKLPSYAFGDCENLKEIYCHNPVPPALGKNVFRGVNKDDCQLYLTSGGDDGYRSADTWKDFFGASHIDAVSADGHIACISGEIIVKGHEGELIEISSLDGKKLYSRLAAGNEVSVKMPAGVYIVKAGEITGKVINR